MSLNVQLSRRITLDGLDPVNATRNLIKFINLGVGEDRNVALGYKSQVKFDKKNLIGYNIGIGYECLYYNSTSQYNVGIGYECLRGGESADGGTIDSNLFTGSNNNVAIGYQCGQFVGNEATNNVLIGFECAKATTSDKFVGDSNTYIGYQCGLLNIGGSENVAIGTNCLDSNTTGNQNVAIGKECLKSNVLGISNVALGYQSLYSNTANNNTAIGYQCSYFNSSGQYNTAIGYKCLMGETDVYTGTNNNVAIGYQCGQFVGNEAINNVLIGYECAKAATGEGEFVGHSNTYIGYQCGLVNTSGSENVGIGYECLLNNIIGAENVAIGYQSLKGKNDSNDTTDTTRNILNNVAVGYQCGAFISNKSTDLSNIDPNHEEHFDSGKNNVLVGYKCGSGYKVSNVQGGTIIEYTVDGKQYRLHKFTTNGTFIVETGANSSLVDVDYLVVGGGGGGSGPISGSHEGAGGGGGGIIYKTNQTLNNGTYTINVGAGGIGSYQNQQTNGGDSSIQEVDSNQIIAIAKGGGAGAGGVGGNGNSIGGSGGGGRHHEGKGGVVISNVTPNSHTLLAGAGAGGSDAFSDGSNGDVYTSSSFFGSSTSYPSSNVYNNRSTFWYSKTTISDWWIQYGFIDKKLVTKYALWPSTGSISTPRRWELRAADNNDDFNNGNYQVLHKVYLESTNNWDFIGMRNLSSSAEMVSEQEANDNTHLANIYYFDNTTKYKFYRLQILQNYGYSRTSIGEWALYEGNLDEITSSTSIGFGNNGGDNDPSNKDDYNNFGGGGGGAGAPGYTNNEDSNSGTTDNTTEYLNANLRGRGGIGKPYKIEDGTNYKYYGGGGGGGRHNPAAQGGLGGGGTGATDYNNNATSGLPNTGGGGGGASQSSPYQNPGGSGGSGIVYIRYKLGTGNDENDLGNLQDLVEGTFSGRENVLIGYKSGIKITRGYRNVGIGYESLFENKSGSDNVSIGYKSLYNNEIGIQNVAIGYECLYNNIVSSNTAIGYSCLYNNTTGENNTSIGYECSLSNTTGKSNTSIGYQCTYSNISGYNNVSFGYQSLYSNTDGFNNISIGYQCNRNINGINNISIGYQSIEGKPNASNLENNIGIGYQCGIGVGSNASDNIMIGYQCGYGTNTGQTKTISRLGNNLNGTKQFQYYGYSVSSSSTDPYKIVIGSPRQNNGNLRYAGCVKIYYYDTDNWILEKEILGTNSYTYLGHAVKISSDGTHLVIGSPYERGPNNSWGSGSLRIYKYNEGDWHIQQIKNPDTGINQNVFYGEFREYSALTVDISSDGTTIVQGGYGDYNYNSRLYYQGKVRFWRYNQSSSCWELKGTFKAGLIDSSYNSLSSSEKSATNFYRASYVSVSGNGLTLAIGIPGYSTSTQTRIGSVVIYTYDVTLSTFSALVESTHRIVGENRNDSFGISLALDKLGNNIIIGALDFSNRFKGYIKVYKKSSNNTYSFNSLDKIQGTNNYDYFGSSVDITKNIDISSTSTNKNLIIIGAKYNDRGGTNAGLIQMYEFTNNSTSTEISNLTKIGEDRIGEDRYNYFGHDVSISSQSSTNDLIVLIGAYGNLRFTGYAKAFQIEDISNKGIQNILIGSSCGFSNKSGSENIGIGYECLKNNEDGIKNVSIGYQTLYSTTSQVGNVSIGYRSLYGDGNYEDDNDNNIVANYSNIEFLTTNETYNIAIGYESSFKNIYGKKNVAVGTQCLVNNVYGSENVAVGYQNIFNSDSSYANVAIGYRSLYNSIGTASDRCVGVGFECLYNNRSSSNIAVGYQSLYNNYGGISNIAFGYQSGYSGLTDTTYSKWKHIDEQYPYIDNNSPDLFTTTGYRYYKLNITKPIDDGAVLSFSELALYDENNSLIIGAGITHTAANATLSGTTQDSVGSNWAGSFDNIITDDTPGNIFHENESNTPASGYLQIDFGNGVTKKVLRYRIWARPEHHTDQAPKEWTFEASNDGTNWTILDERTDESLWPKVTGTNASTSISQSNEYIIAKEGLGHCVKTNVDGTIMAVSQPNYQYKTGRVIIYQASSDNTGWTQKAIINNTESNPTFDCFGYNIALNSTGTYIVITATQSTTGVGYFKVYNYTTDITSWSVVGSKQINDVTKNGNSITNNNDNFGYYADINDNGDRVIISSPKNRDSNSNEDLHDGYCRIYEYSSTSNSWSELGGSEFSTFYGDNVGDELGSSVAINSSGNIVAIGSPYYEGLNGTNQGLVRLYRYDSIKLAIYENTSSIYYGPRRWTRFGNDILGEAQDDLSGYTLALNADGTIVAIGAYKNDGSNGTDSGHVRVYQYVSNDWIQIGEDIDGERTNDESSTTLALNDKGDILAIGSSKNNEDYRYFKLSIISSTNENILSLLELALYDDVYNSIIGAGLSADSAGAIITGTKQDESGNLKGAFDNSLDTSDPTVNTTFTIDSNNWTQKGADIDGEASFDFSGHSVSLSSDGTIVAIGAYLNNGARGHVRVYEYNNSNNSWSQLGADIDGETSTDYCGFSVSLSSDGTIVAIGSPRHDNNKGHARVYQYNNNGNSWSQLGADIDGDASGDFSGTTVSLSSDGTIIAIGSPLHDSSKGHVRVYEWTGSDWIQKGIDIDGAVAGDQSGTTVSLSSDGTIVAIGSPLHDSSKGHVRVYEWTVIYNNENVSGSWNIKGSDIDGEVAGDGSGKSVSLSSDGTILAIGANLNDGNSSNSSDNRGHIRIYKYVSNDWKKVGIDIDGATADDGSGISVSLSSDGTIVAIGSSIHDVLKGHVRIFEIDEIVAREWDSNTPLAELVIDFGDNNKKKLTRYNIWATTLSSFRYYKLNITETVDNSSILSFNELALYDENGNLVIGAGTTHTSAGATLSGTTQSSSGSLAGAFDNIITTTSGNIFQVVDNNGNSASGYLQIDFGTGVTKKFSMYRIWATSISSNFRYYKLNITAPVDDGQIVIFNELALYDENGNLVIGAGATATTAGATITGTTQSSSGSLIGAFDNIITTTNGHIFKVDNNGTPVNGYLQIEFETTKKISMYRIWATSALSSFRYYKLNITATVDNGSILSFNELALYDENSNLVIGAGTTHTSAGATLSGTTQTSSGSLAGAFDNTITTTNGNIFQVDNNGNPASGYLQIDFGIGVTKKISEYRIWATSTYFSFRYYKLNITSPISNSSVLAFNELALYDENGNLVIGAGTTHTSAGATLSGTTQHSITFPVPFSSPVTITIGSLEKLFDNTLGTFDGFWEGLNDNPATGHIQIDFGVGNTKKISEYRIWGASITEYSPKNWTFEGSNDGTNWTILDTRTNENTWPTITGTVASTSINQSNLYTITNQKEPKNWTFEGSNDGTNWTILDTRTNETSWPTITGTVASNSISQSNQYTITNTNQQKEPKNWTFEGSNDGTNWTILDTRTNQTSWPTITGIVASNSISESKQYNIINTEQRPPKSWTFEGSNDGNNWTILDTRTNENTWSTITGTFASNNISQSNQYNISNAGAPKKWTLEGSNDGTNWRILDERDNETIWPTITGTSADESLHESNAYYIPKGHVRVYNFSSGGWLSLGDDIDNTIYANESYSKSIDISGDGTKLIIGIPTYNNGYGRVETRSFINDGSYNVFIGYEVGYSNTTGLSNVYIGYKSGYSNTTGSNNIGIGQENLLFNTTGINNTAIGFKSSYSNTTGFENVSLGRESLYSNTTGNSNTAIGYQSLYNSNINGNTAIGTKCLSQTTLTNIELTDINTYNVGIGTECSLQLVGKGNTAIGTQCLASDFTYSTINTTNDSMFIEPIYFILSGSADLHRTSSISDTIKLNTASTYKSGLAKIKITQNSTSLDTGNYTIKFDFKMSVASPTENYFYIIIGSKNVTSNQSSNNQGTYSSSSASSWFFQKNGLDPKEGIFNGIVIMFKTLTTTDSILVYYDNNSTSRAIISEASTSGSINFGTDTFRSYTLSYVSSTKLLTLTDGIFTKTYSFNGITNINDDYITFGSSTHHTGTNSENYINNIKFSLSLVNSKNNTAIGFKNLFSNASGELNTAIGSESLYSNKSGYNNVSIGSNTLYNNDSGYENTSIGYNSSFKNTDGHNNITIGTNVSYNNRSGNNNVICGNDSNFKSEYNSNNIIYGNNNLYNAKGGFNTIIGNDNISTSNYYVYGKTNNVTATTLVLDSQTKEKITRNTDDYKIYIGWKICFTNGYGAGITRTISDMSYSDPLYTITVDSAFPSFSEIGYRYYKLNITRPIDDGASLNFSELALYDENDNLIIGAGTTHTAANATLSGTIQSSIGSLTGAFDNIITTTNSNIFEEGNSGSPATGYLQIDFGSGVTKKVGMYRIWATSGHHTNQAPKDWTFEASSDGSNWVVLDKRAGITTWPAVSGTNASSNIDKANEFRKIRNGSDPICYKLYFDLYNSIKNEIDIEYGYITASSNNTITLKRQSSLINDHYSRREQHVENDGSFFHKDYFTNSYYIEIVDSYDSDEIGQTRAINDYNSSTNVITVISNWNNNPSVHSKYKIFSLLEYLHSYPVYQAITEQNKFVVRWNLGYFAQKYQGSDLIFVKTSNNTQSNLGKLNRVISTENIGSGTRSITIVTEFPFEILPEVNDRVIFYDEKISEYNVFMGYKNSQNEIDSKYNIAIGNENLSNNCNSIQNIAIGNFSLFNTNFALYKRYENVDFHSPPNLMTGFNTLSDWQAGSKDISYGGFNIGIGLFSGFHNTIGKNNISLGIEALYNNQKGHNNIALGHQALKGLIGEKGSASYPKGRLITPTSNNQNDAFISKMYQNGTNSGTLESTSSEFKYAGSDTTCTTSNSLIGGSTEYYIRLTDNNDSNGRFWNDKYRFYDKFPDTFLFEFEMFLGGGNQAGEDFRFCIGDKYQPAYASSDYLGGVGRGMGIHNGYYFALSTYNYPAANYPYSDHAIHIQYHENNDIDSGIPWGFNYRSSSNSDLKKVETIGSKYITGDTSSSVYYAHSSGWDNDTWQTIKVLFNRGEITFLRDNYVICKFCDKDYKSRNISGATDRPYIWFSTSNGGAKHIVCIKNIKFSENISNLDVNPYSNVSALGPYAGNFNYDTLITTPIVDYDVFIGGGEGDNYQLIHANCNNTSRNWSPAVNNAVDLGTSTKAWKNAYIAGNVGIGTTSPTEKLDINGNLHIEGDYICIRSDSNNDGNTGKPALYFSEDNYDSSDSISHNDSGNVRIIYDGDGKQGNDNFIAIQGRTAANQFNNTLLHCTMGGNVGIGTNSPDTKFRVNGRIAMRGNGTSGNASSTRSTSGIQIGGYWINDWHHVWLYWYYNGTHSVRFSADNNLHTLSFTGQHICILNKNIDNSGKGLIVSSSGKYINLDNSTDARINESLPICDITKIDNDTKIFGIISDKEDTDNSRYHGVNVESIIQKTNKNEQRTYINSLGEGAVWVCNKNGVLVNGDYISSSSVPGYGMKQTLNQNILANHTVAKITCDCDFSFTKIVKQKLKVIITTETYEENVTEDVEKTTTETKVEYDSTLSRYVQKEVTTTTTEKEQVYDTFDLYNEEGEVIGTHKVERKETKTKTITEIDYDANGDVQYEDDLDADGNQQMIYPFETRFLQADGTQITETEYNTKLAAEEEVYISCFVGCTYHCG